MLLRGAVAILAGASTQVGIAAPAVPDACKLVTVAEVEQVVGPLKGKPKPGGPGEASCEFTPVKGPAWIKISLAEGDLAYWKRRNGGPKPVSAPEFGNDAFVNPDSEGSVELFVKKGNLVMRISGPKGTTVDMIKAIAKKAMAH